MKKISFIILSILTFIMVISSVYVISEAATVGVLGKNWDSGNVTAEHTGWLNINGNVYYIHKTKSTKYDIGEACRNDYRWRNGKLYYFKDDGRMQTKNSCYIKLDADHSLERIIIAGSNGKDCYNAKRKRYQHKINGHWHDVGMQTNVWWMCDWQE